MSDNLLAVTKGIEDLLFKIDAMEESGEIIPNELKDLLNHLVDRQADKVDAVVSFHNYSESQIEWLKGEKKKIDLIIKRYERGQERLEYIARNAIISQNITEIEGKLNKIRVQKYEYVEILDQSQVPETHMRTKIVIEPDKDFIKADLKAGHSVPGCILAIREKAQFK